MCSIGDYHLEDTTETSKYMIKKEKLSLLGNKCNKCREAKPCIVLRVKDCYCRNCFLAGTVHKFKALLGKHRLIHPNDRVLVVHKAGNPSTALLSFLRNGLDLNTAKKLRFQPIVLFVESHYHLSVEERKDLLRNIERQVNLFKFDLYFISLIEFLANPDKLQNLIVEESKDLNLKENNREQLKHCIAKQSNETNENDFLHLTRRQLLIDAAKYLKCQFVFTSELSMDVASQLLTNISLGRGSHVPIDTGFCDSRDDDVMILRPLRLFDAKELAFYNYFNGLDCVSFRELKENTYSSIQNLMKKFVTDLQINYPATVTTILKTGDKLAIDQNLVSDNSNKCLLCKAPMNCENFTLTSAESTRFSHWVSTQTPDHEVSGQERYNKAVQSFQNLYSKKYCFACQKLV